MSRIVIESPVGFADSEILGYSRSDDVFRVKIEAWNQSVLFVVFKKTIAVRDLNAWSISQLCEEKNESDLLRRALRNQYEVIPTNHEWRVFCFLCQDGSPGFEVVAEDMQIIHH